MIRAFARGFREMMQATCFRGPWAYTCMAEREAAPVETARDLGEWVAVVMVRGDERRKRRSADSSSSTQEKK